MDAFSQSFDEFIKVLQDWGILKQVSNTALLIVAFLFFRWGVVHIIGRWQTQRPEEKRRWIVQVKNLSLLILVFGLLAIWMSELRTFAISLVAVAAALVISTKEIILCFMGSAYKASGKPFELGDRIEINGVRGEVIDHNLFGTTLMEVGPFRDANQHSGRQVMIPNSWLLNWPVYNQSNQQEYVLHSLRIPMAREEDWRKVEEALLQAANQECAGFLEPARWSMVRLGQIQGLDLPRVEPRVNFQIHEEGRVHAILRVPARAATVSKTEQAIIRIFLEKRKLGLA